MIDYLIEMKVKLIGHTRWTPENSSFLITLDNAHSISPNCLDLNRIPPDDFMNCKFTNLLPNRNYTGAVVAVNGAGESESAIFPQQCITDFAGFSMNFYNFNVYKKKFFFF